jgi:Mce-associated membrane protein
VSTIRRPRVAGTAPAAQRTATADRSVPDDVRTRPIPLGSVPVAEPSAPGPSDLSPPTRRPDGPTLDEPAAEKPAQEKPAPETSASEEPTTEERAATLRGPVALRTTPVEEQAADLASASGSRRSMWVPLLAAALVVLTGLAVFFGIGDARLRDTPAAANSALVDVGTTAEVSGQLTDALQTIYSYDFARLDENERAARAVITPEFADQFNRLFAQVRDLAPQQQAVVSATVTLAAVKEITGDRAVLVAFMDQQATRAAADDGQPTQLAAAGRLTVTGQKVDGRCKIAGVESN